MKVIYWIIAITLPAIMKLNYCNKIIAQAANISWWMSDTTKLKVFGKFVF